MSPYDGFFGMFSFVRKRPFFLFFKILLTNFTTYNIRTLCFALKNKEYIVYNNQTN